MSAVACWCVFTEDEFDVRDIDEGKNFKYFLILQSNFDRLVGLVISTTSYVTSV